MSTSTGFSKRSGDVTDADYMARALFHAARGRGRTTPNPVVGAVIVSADGVVVGEGFHARAGAPHAEVNALDVAGSRARGATLYCSLEPCCHTGRTGPVRGANRRRRHHARRGSRPGSESARARTRLRVSRVARDQGGRRDRTCGGSPAQSAVLHAHERRTTVRHAEGGGQRGRLHCRGARSPDRADVGRRQPARAANSRRNRRDWRRRRDDSGRRSAVDGARRVSRVAADSRDFRPPFADATECPRPLDSRGRACHDLDGGRRQPTRPNSASRWKPAVPRLSRPMARFAPGCALWAIAASPRSCSKAAPRCTKRPGPNTSSTTCGCM